MGVESGTTDPDACTSTVLIDPDAARAVDACDAPDGVLVVCRHDGGARLDVDGGVAGATGPGLGGWVIDRPTQSRVTVSDAPDMTVVVLDRGFVAEYAAQTCGIDPVALRFHTVHPPSPALARYWASTVTFVRDDLTADSGHGVGRVIADTAHRALCAALLSTFPNSATDALRGRSTPAPPAE